MIYVVVQKSSKVSYTKWTRLPKTSVKLVSELEEPSSYEEAILDQHPDIDEALDKVMAELAKCKISTIMGDSDEITRILLEKLELAQAHQRAKGNKAMWRDVEWPLPEDVE